MRRRDFLRATVTAVGGIAVGTGVSTAADSQLEPGTWYDATVTDVTDGDTIDVTLDSDGTEYEIRVLGLDTPETKRNGQYESIEEWEGIEDDRYLADWGETAKDYAQTEFPDGTSVQITVDSEEDEFDVYDRLLAYIRYDKSGDGAMDTLYNEDIISQGYARVYGSNLSRHDEFWQAEADARAAGRRVWQQSDPNNSTEVDDDPVDSVFAPNTSSIRTDTGAIAASRVPVFAESTAYQNLGSGAVDYNDIPLVGVDEAANVAMIGGLSINEAHESDQQGQHEVFLTNLLDWLSDTTGQVLIEGGHRQFNATYALSNEDAVYYQRYLEGQDLAFEQVNSLDGTGGNALSTARAIIITNPPEAYTTSETDALSTFTSNGGSVILMGSALASDSARANLDDIAAALGSDLRLNNDQVYDDSNNVGDAALLLTSNFDTSFPLFDPFTGSSDGGGGGGNAPTVDSLSLAEDNGGGNPHADFTASWSVSDADGDLDTVDLALTDVDDGEAEDSTTVDVSGGTASGSTTLSASKEETSGHTYEVELTVTDAGGNTASAIAQEIEDGS